MLASDMLHQPDLASRAEDPLETLQVFSWANPRYREPEKRSRRRSLRHRTEALLPVPQTTRISATAAFAASSAAARRSSFGSIAATFAFGP